MEGKNIGAVMLTIFLILFFAIIGSSFMAFVYPGKKVVVGDPKIVLEEGINVTNDKNETINSLKLSTSKLGLKPVTGEDDPDYEIPTTVTDQKGSEGLYSTFYLTSQTKWALYVTDIKVEGAENVSDEREHIKVGLKDVLNSSQTLEGDKVKIASGNAISEPLEMTFYVWLHSLSGEALVGANISFTLSFEEDV
ncbi:MAG: hypothetical protein J5689_01215 [Clostridia bacterium]|nr:hypothetical protein [Clostridia bacterium]